MTDVATMDMILGTRSGYNHQGSAGQNPLQKRISVGQSQAQQRRS
jgi:hypothetical protein